MQWLMSLRQYEQYEMLPDAILVLYGWHVLLNFALFCLTCNNIVHLLPLPLYAGYIVSVRRMVIMDNIVIVKSSC